MTAKQETRCVLMAVSYEIPLKPNALTFQVDRVFRKLDLNQDGIITIEEFLEACLKDDLVTQSLQMFDVDICL